MNSKWVTTQSNVLADIKILATFMCFDKLTDNLWNSHDHQFFLRCRWRHYNKNKAIHITIMLICPHSIRHTRWHTRCGRTCYSESFRADEAIGPGGPAGPRRSPSDSSSTCWARSWKYWLYQSLWCFVVNRSICLRHGKRKRIVVKQDDIAVY